MANQSGKGQIIKFTFFSAIDSEEIADDVISKLIIMTPSRRTLDRTGDFTTRSQNQVEFNEEVEIGLRQYEEELWTVPLEKEAPVRLFSEILKIMEYSFFYHVIVACSDSHLNKYQSKLYCSRVVSTPVTDVQSFDDFGGAVPSNARR